MKVIDLCCGLGGATRAFKHRGHNVFTVDKEPKFVPDLVADVRWLTKKDLPFEPDFIWASPPCNGFSVASIGKCWKDGKPNKTAKEGITIVDACLRIIYSLRPKYWIIENPRGMMRRVLGKPKVTTYFASWGEPNYKPTDLWGDIPPMDFPEPKNWEKAPRGSLTGTQGIKSPELKAMIPYGLSLAVCKAIEDNLEQKTIFNFNE